MAPNIKKDFGSKKAKPDLSTMVYGKVPPQAPELEEAVLGACMLEKDTFTLVQDIIHSEECLYVDAHQKIYAAMRRLYNVGQPVDLLTITEELRKSNELELVGGAYALTKLTMSVLSSANVEAHARIVMEKFMLREIIRISGAAISQAYENDADPFDLVDEVESQVKKITDGLVVDDNISVGDTFRQVVEQYEIQKQTKSPLIGLNTGFCDLNEMIGGFKTPALIILAAYPSFGKTALMLELMRKMEISNAGIRGKAYSLETGNINLTRRMAAAECRINFDRLQRGVLDMHEENALMKSANAFMRKKISFSTKKFFIEDIERDARKMKKKHPDLKAIFLDFIQLVKLRNNIEKLNEVQIVGEVSRRLKLLSSELEIPIIALSQLNNEDRKNGDKRPRGHNLAKSGQSLEQNADVIIFIWYNDVNGKKEPLLIVAKNKDGKVGDVPIQFNADTQNWDDYGFSTGVLPAFVSNQNNYQPYPQNDGPF